jgi:hypothetical protein
VGFLSVLAVLLAGRQRGGNKDIKIPLCAVLAALRWVVSVHPSALLRIEGENDKQAAYKEFVVDLKVAATASTEA